MKLRNVVWGLVLSALVLVVAAVLILRSHWFSSYIRQQIVVAIQNATGTRASIDDFSFSWTDLVAQVDGLTLHGTEPAGSPPLLHAAHIQMGLRSRFLAAGRIRISRIQVDSPAVYILCRPDGSTNLPALQAATHSSMSDVIRLRIGSSRINNGYLQINDYRTPLNLDAGNLFFEARYQRTRSQYDLQFSVDPIIFKITTIQQPRTAVSLKASLSAQRLVINTLDIRAGNSTIKAQGLVASFAHPNIDLHTYLAVDGRDVAQAGDLPWLKSASVDVNGQFHYDPASKAMFTGTAVGRNVTYSRSGITVSNGSFTSDVFASPERIEVSHLNLKALSGAVLGKLEFVNLTRMLFRGSVHGVDARSFMLLLIKDSLPFNASVTGPVTLDTHLGNELTNTTITAKVDVTPPLDRPGVSGLIDLIYRQATDSVLFGPSDLTFPHTNVHLEGELNGALSLRASSTQITELEPTFHWLGLTIPQSVGFNPQSQGSFSGEVRGALDSPSVRGRLQASNFNISGKHWDSISSDFSASDKYLRLTSFNLSGHTAQVQLTGEIGLKNWNSDSKSALALKVSVQSNDFGSIVRSFTSRADSLMGGTVSASVNLAGTLQELGGSGGLNVRDTELFDEKIDRFHAAIIVKGDKAEITGAKLTVGGASAAFAATYKHSLDTWANGELHLQADTNRFPIQSLAHLHRLIPALGARAELHGQGDFRILPSRVDPLSVNGTLAVTDITIGAVRRGDVTWNAGTEGDLLTVGLAGDLEAAPISGNLRAHLTGDDPSSGELHFGKLNLDAALAVLSPGNQLRSGWDGTLSGNWTFAGPLRNLEGITSTLTVESVTLRSVEPLPGGLSQDQFILRNEGPVVIDTAGSIAKLRHLQFATRDTRMSVTGSLDLLTRRLDLHADGSTDLRVAELVYPELQTSGTANLSLSVGGVPDRPNFRGALQVKDAAVILPDLTNGFTGINGTLRFDRNRAVLEEVTGQTGGGAVHLAGVMTFGGAQPTTYNLEATASHVRFRYLRASVTGDASLQMTGTTQTGLISGDVAISRIVFEPGADLANVLANAATPTATPVNEQDFLTGLGLDIHVQSSPNLQVLTSLSHDVQADIDLRLRGTRDHPALLGHISANQGEVNVFGTRYTISRGNITFINAVRIEPVLDLDLQTETRGITVDVVVTGTLSKLNMSYRSDPPLQAKDIIALLTVGQTPTLAAESSNSRAQADTTALQAGATTVLGQAISPTNNRLSKLFGITNVRIDPFVQNISNARQARLTLEQQISRDITVTYVTNLAQTSEQIFRFEWAFNPQYSVVAVRDDNGEFGIDIQYKKRFK